MNNEKLKRIHKFESEDRLKELGIKGSLEALNFTKNKTLVDIGSGTGIFAFEASKYEGSKIYSIEISDLMIEIQEDKIKENNINNVEIIKQNVDDNKILMDDETCDVVTMTTVLHEIDDKENIIKEISRVLKPKGKYLVIEFHNRETGFGPSLEERLSSGDIEDICNKFNLEKIEEDILGGNFYRVIFQKS